MKKYDAIIVGAGPNGFAAAITLQQEGLSTLLIEGESTIGGGMRTKALTLPGFMHDVCSAVHPMAKISPFFKSLPLEKFGLTFTEAPIEMAHPLENGPAAFLYRDIGLTSSELGVDGKLYRKLIGSVVNHWDRFMKDFLGPLRYPENPLSYASFGVKALFPASWTARLFETEKARALWAGMAAHGIQPLSNFGTSAYAQILLAVGHMEGWAIPIGGSQSIADTLAAYYQSLGGEIQTSFKLVNKADLPDHNILILNLTPQQILNIEGLDLQVRYRRQLQRYRQGMGVFKIDWALSEPAPFKDRNCLMASTVHIGNTYSEIANYEREAHNGKLGENPFVLFSQPSLFDKTRAPEGKHVGWAYCHVPHGSQADFTEAIERQIERFAPGFRDTILARSTMGPRQMEEYNPNYVGGDINGGLMDMLQLYTRPVFSLTPYRTSNKHVYISSSSTPPGGGVHGMCGFHAARTALKDHYSIEINL